MRLLSGVSASAAASLLPSPLFPFSRANSRRMPTSASASACRAASSSASTGDAGGGTQTPWLFVGLGNPGKMYQGTRHNVGFEMIDVIAEAEGISVSSMQFKAMVGKGVKSLLMLKILRISSGVLLFIMSATVWQVKSSNPLISK